MTDFKTIEPKPGVKLLAVKVPENSRNFGTDNSYQTRTRIMYWDTLNEWNSSFFVEGKHTLLGISTELTEEQCLEIMPEFECPNQWCENGYIDQGYNQKWRCDYCQQEEDDESGYRDRLATLMQSEGLTNGKYLILKIVE